MADILLDSIGLLPVEIDHTVPNYPFTVQGDFTTLIITRTYRQLAAAYTPAQPGITRDSRPSNADDDTVYYPDAVLISPENVRPIGLGLVVEFSRTFARIPPTHYEPASRLFDRPAMHDVKSGTTYFVSFDNGVTSHRFASRVTVSSISDPAITYTNPNNEQVQIGAQSVTVEANNSAETFNLNDSDTTIKNAMSTAVTGGTGNAANFYVSRWKFGVYISWAGISVTVKGITISTTDITIGERTIAVGTASSTGPIEFLAAATVLTSTRTVNATGHGGLAGNRVALYNGDRIVALSKVVGKTTDAFTIPTKDLPDADAVVTHCVFDEDAAARYENGPIDCSARVAVRFYLPGVTSGVAAMSDVPNFTPKTSPVAWAGEIVSYAASPSTATYAAIETAALERWLDGPILVKRVVELQLADALTTCATTG